MSNESLFLLAAFTDILFVFIATRLGREWLLGTIITNLILIGIFGAKLISVFGFITNVGNVFYACVFLATHFLLERQNKQAGIKMIWLGAGFVVFFTALSQLAVHSSGSPLSEAANNASSTLFSFSPRVVFASILAYIFAQYINISLYEWFRARTRGKFLWLRSNGANIISQFADSSLFFTIAFLDLPGPLLVQAILIGWFVKTLVVFIGTPFLYIDAHLERKK